MLLWLKANNLLYKDIAINFDLTNTWERDFVPAGVSNRVSQYYKDMQEKGYTTDLDTDDFKKDLYNAINVAGISNSGLLSGCFMLI